MLLFGGQADRFRPRTAHTWATYVKATPGAPLEGFTISWLPASLDVRPGRVRAEPGANVSLHRTLDLMAGGNRRVSLWGPFEITRDFYEASHRRRCFLDGGGSRYRVLSVIDRRPDVNHCVDAIVRADPALDRAVGPVLWYGEAISQRVANALAKTGIVPRPQVTHDWLIAALDLGRYDLRREPVGQPAWIHLLPGR